MARRPITPRGFRFGPFEADLRARELRKQGRKIRLQEQPFRVLAALARRPSELVTREELRQELWPDDTFVDFEHGLNAAVRRLREALTDSADAPRYVETLPRLGYRLAAPVVTLPDPEDGPPARVMLAVLPFDSPGKAPDGDYFADGMTDEMIGQLGRLDPARLGVIARTSTIRYKSPTRSVDGIGRELGVDFLLEGSVRRSGKHVRITARLVRVADQSHLWSESYDEILEDVLVIQIECARRIARSLALELVPARQNAMACAVSTNTTAYEAYLQGRYYWNKRTADAFGQAIDSFETSIAADPGFALAPVGLADVWNLLGLYSIVPPGTAGPRARSAAERALAIDPLLGEAHVSLAHNRFLYEWDRTGAEEGFRRGLTLNPNLAHGHYLYAFLLASGERFGEAFAHMDQARTLDPVSRVIHTYFAWVCYFSRDFDRAISGFRKALELDPGFSLASLFLGLAYLQKAEWGPAIEALKQARESSGSHASATSGLAVALSLDGRRNEAEEIIDSVSRQASGEYLSPYYGALAALGMGDPNRALDQLETAFEERSPWLVCLPVEPAMDTLRPDPRFRELVRRIGVASGPESSRHLRPT